MAVKTTSSLTGYLPFAWNSLALSRDPGLDLIQAEYIPHSSLIPAFFRKKNIPLVLKFHGDDARIYPLKNGFNRMLTRDMLRRASYIITGSEEMKRILISLGEVPERISSIHTGVDTGFFTPLNRDDCRRILGLPQDKMVFLFVGRLHPWKGIRELIAVARECPDFSFCFLGPGTVPDHPSNCRFVGTQMPEAVRTWMNAADCLLLPTYTESVPTSVMEAFACGIPAITTDVGGCPEIVEEGKTGYLIPVRDTIALKDAVIRMYHNPWERRAMGQQARITVKERYDHNLQIDKLVDIHTTLIRNG